MYACAVRKKYSYSKVFLMIFEADDQCIIKKPSGEMLVFPSLIQAKIYLEKHNYDVTKILHSY